MVGGVQVNVLVPDLRAGSNDEGPAELVHSLATLSNAIAIAMGAPRTLEASGIEQQRGVVDLADRSRARRVGGVVDEDGKRDPFVGNEGLGVALVTRSDGDDVCACSGDLVVGVSQLRGVFPAEQSAEVAEKDEDDRTVGPERAETVAPTVSADEFDFRQPLQIHADNMPHGPRLRPRCP